MGLWLGHGLGMGGLVHGLGHGLGPWGWDLEEPGELGVTVGHPDLAARRGLLAERGDDAAEGEQRLVDVLPLALLRKTAQPLVLRRTAGLSLVQGRVRFM